MVDAGVGGRCKPSSIASRTHRQCSPLSGANKKRTPGAVPDVPSYFIHFMYHFVSAYAITSLIAAISSS